MIAERRDNGEGEEGEKGQTRTEMDMRKKRNTERRDRRTMGEEANMSGEKRIMDGRELQGQPEGKEEMEPDRRAQFHPDPSLRWANAGLLVGCCSNSAQK